MKIDGISKKKIKLVDIKYGQVFEFEDYYYIAVKDEESKLAKHLICFEFLTETLVDLPLDSMVTLVNYKLEITCHEN